MEGLTMMVRGRHIEPKSRRTFKWDVLALVVLGFGLSAIVWGPLVGFWFLLGIMAVRIVGLLVWRKAIARRSNR